MIFVCLGTQTFQFDRLLIELDNLVASRFIEAKDLVVQSGTINYIPKNFEYVRFLSHVEFEEIRKRADLIISHGGTGSLIGAAKLGKNIIGVPRAHKYGEHVDDHQMQIVRVLEEQGYIRAVYDMKDLRATIQEAMEKPLNKIYPSKSKIVSIISTFIDSN